ncbi:hypothetical protein EJ06DRAFT_6133 [Trichodelitschia bisporula]|uniref:Fibrinogen C-terminal domain-containing protein n=1 Tax=Trichodelitschia bisporula TaxID=703511 RepID=A0A6G1IAG2_9PEZI|nr:hypothetical protein EJ06DRAFT_6133 [Trichodelitschia bisporula]
MGWRFRWTTMVSLHTRRYQLSDPARRYDGQGDACLYELGSGWWYNSLSGSSSHLQVLFMDGRGTALYDGGYTGMALWKCMAYSGLCTMSEMACSRFYGLMGSKKDGIACTGGA